MPVLGGISVSLSLFTLPLSLIHKQVLHELRQLGLALIEARLLQPQTAAAASPGPAGGRMPLARLIPRVSALSTGELSLHSNFGYGGALPRIIARAESSPCSAARSAAAVPIGAVCRCGRVARGAAAIGGHLLGVLILTIHHVAWSTDEARNRLIPDR